MGISYIIDIPSNRIYFLVCGYWIIRGGVGEGNMSAKSSEKCLNENEGHCHVFFLMWIEFSGLSLFLVG